MKRGGATGFYPAAPYNEYRSFALSRLRRVPGIPEVLARGLPAETELPLQTRILPPLGDLDFQRR